MQAEQQTESSICRFTSQVSATTRVGLCFCQEFFLVSQRQGFKPLLPPRSSSRRLEWKQSHWNLNWHSDLGCSCHSRSYTTASALTFYLQKASLFKNLPSCIPLASFLWSQQFSLALPHRDPKLSARVCHSLHVFHCVFH